MFVKKIISALLAAAALHITAAGAVGTLIPSTNRVDMVHDAARNLVYITDGGSVLRYSTLSNSFLSPIVLGGSLAGIDISPDGSTLAVANKVGNAASQWVHLVKLNDLSVVNASVPKAFYEDGFFAVAYGADGTLVASSRFAGSGWVPMRRLNPATLYWTQIGTSYPDNTFRQDTMVSASGNGKVIAFAESNISSGDWGRLDLGTGQLTHRNAFNAGTQAFNYEIATNSNGSQYAIPTYFGTYIYNSSFAKQATIGQYAGAQPVGVAFHPVNNLIYFPFAQTREVRVYDAVNLTQVASHDFENTFTSNGNHAFQQGRTKLSKDGSLLMVSVAGGVRMLRLYAPLAANGIAAVTNADIPVSMTLQGSIGNNGALKYSLASMPQNGTATIIGSTLTYVPNPGFAGNDSFSYAVSYGGNTVKATIGISVAGVATVPGDTSLRATTNQARVLKAAAKQVNK